MKSSPPKFWPVIMVSLLLVAAVVAFGQQNNPPCNDASAQGSRCGTPIFYGCNGRDTSCEEITCDSYRYGCTGPQNDFSCVSVPSTAQCILIHHLSEVISTENSSACICTDPLDEDGTPINVPCEVVTQETAGCPIPPP